MRKADKAFCEMYGVSEEELARDYQSGSGPSFYREFKIFFEDVRRAYDMEMPELESHILRAGYESCTQMGRGYLQIKAYHEGF